MQPVVWHSIESDETLRRLESSASGLSTADALKRLTEHGPNTHPEKRRRSLLLGQFTDFMIIVLLLAALRFLQRTTEFMGVHN